MKNWSNNRSNDIKLKLYIKKKYSKHITVVLFVLKRIHFVFEQVAAWGLPSYFPPFFSWGSTIVTS